MLVHIRSSFTAATLLLLTSFFNLAQADDWKPLDPAHMALKEPVVEKDADAECLLWEVKIKDEEDARTVTWHYLRVKIFTERGKEKHGTVELPYASDTRITDIAARTIKPDGSIVDLKKDAVFDRTIVKQGRLKVNAKSFAMPAVEPGVIIEYRYREETDLSAYLRLDFHQDIPVHRVRYLIKPYTSRTFPYGMRSIPFHGQFPKYVKEKDGFFSTELTNVPALQDEPYMPPEKQVGPWILVYYSEDRKLTPDSYWKEYGRELYEATRQMMKVNDEIKKAAAAAIGDETDPDKKLERLYSFCKTKIKNVDNDGSGLSGSQRNKVKENKSPSDTLKRGVGDTIDIDMLFAALSSAAGFDVRYSRLADRSDIFFYPDLADRYFLRTYDVAIKVGDQWRFFSPGSSYTTYGMLFWWEEGNHALVADPKEPFFVLTGISGPDKTSEKRTGNFSLTPEGELEGDVRIEYTGHFAIDKKQFNDEDSPQQREETLTELIRKRLSTAELSDIKIENVTDPSRPFVYSFHIKVPGYAQKTGRRLFVQPAFFQKGVSSLFSNSQRRYQIYFPHPWSESDDVTIKLPEGYVLDNADAPGPFTITNVGEYGVKIFSVDGGKALQYKRSFKFGTDKLMLFPVESYPRMKDIFDTIHQRDSHTISLKSN